MLLSFHIIPIPFSASNAVQNAWIEQRASSSFGWRWACQCPASLADARANTRSNVSSLFSPHCSPSRTRKMRRTFSLLRGVK